LNPFQKQNKEYFLSAIENYTELESVKVTMATTEDEKVLHEQTLFKQEIDFHTSKKLNRHN